ncbi:hypothetical protein HMPREF1210_02279 [Paenisporosarcina sp. HGH0030]|uniref:hypothetical protein n=1 Tax=Paenisporosarcina sp. HGH0030 TaxID=1078085 RepID=UPI00034EBE88|nr:hypothetical protein [Paenisporosarcina sp. HGH0030]EPD51088.1 hypothetical protein HMPREF1210_02279 [Paenisporosarcina sp. HGH0030]
MKRLKIGDVFEIVTSNGIGLFQYVHKDETIGELIRILPCLFKEGYVIEDEIVKKKELYLIHFPLGTALNQKLVTKKGSYTIPQDFKLPKKFRSEHMVNGEFICWHIIDYDTWKREKVERMTEEQKQLSPWGTWNDTLLKLRLAEGWTLDRWF